MPASALTPQEEIATHGSAARAILDRWHSRNPQHAPRKLHILVWTPADREPAPNYRQRLSAILFDIQKFYAREMERNGFGPRTIQLITAADGLLDITVVKGSKPYAAYPGHKAGDEIRHDCKVALASKNIDADKETILIFCNMSNWDAGKRTISQNSPYYAGGTNCKGTAWQVDSPILNLEDLTRTDSHVTDGEYGNISIGKYNSIFIGGIAHEMGHALGLPHNLERPDEHAALGDALMSGSGNRTYGDERRKEGKGSFLNFAHALQLASHPMFSGSVKDMHGQPTAQATALNITTRDKDITISGKVTSRVPVYGIIAYFDPEGTDTYDATSATAVPDAEGNFNLQTTALKKGKTGEIRLCFLEANGLGSGFLDKTPYYWSYRVNSDGTVDLSAAQASLMLKPLLTLAKNPEAKPDELLTKLKSIDFSQSTQVVHDAAQAIVRYARREEAALTPAQNTNPTCELAFSQPIAATVGYGRAQPGMLPEEPFLYIADGKLFRNGLYAHAPARHTYHLGGKWTTFTARAGLAAGHNGSVAFKVIGNGKTLFESKAITPGSLASININVTGINELSLESTDAGDGKRDDWAVWLEPTLAR